LQVVGQKEIQEYGEKGRVKQGKLREVVSRYRSLYTWFKTRTNNQDKSIIKASWTGVQKLKAKSEKAYVFPCSLDSVDIPPATPKWRASNDDLPKINNNMFTQYVSMKREGSAGQQKQALQMFTSRKIGP